jgi:hypothetical protein
MRNAGIEDANPPHFIGLLTSGRKARGNERAGGSADDRSPIHQWITSSDDLARNQCILVK